MQQYPHETWSKVEKQFQDELPKVVSAITHHLDTIYEGYKQQQQAFMHHTMSQLQQLQQEKAELEQKVEQIYRQQQRNKCNRCSNSPIERNLNR